MNNRDNSSALEFRLLEPGKDVYNITAPFLSAGEWVLAGRVEARDSEFSEVCFFRPEADAWVEDPTIPRLALQDPFVQRVGEGLIFGGVEVFEEKDIPGRLNYRTVFYRGADLRTMTRFFAGPDRMKDIRLCELPDGRILVLTRPQGTRDTGAEGTFHVGSRGKIGYVIINTLEELTEEIIWSAELLEELFDPAEWGGANEIHLLKNGKVGVLSHIARYDEEGNRHYYSCVFCLDPESGDYTPMKMIAVRDNFREGPAKRPDLVDVIFSGGLVRMKDGKACLYCGVSDAQGHRIIIDDPFVPYER